MSSLYLGPHIFILVILTPQHAGDIHEPFQPPHPRKQGCSSPGSFRVSCLSKSGTQHGIQGPYVQQKSTSVISAPVQCGCSPAGRTPPTHCTHLPTHPLTGPTHSFTHQLAPLLPNLLGLST